MPRQRPLGVVLVAIWFSLAGLMAAIGGAGLAFSFQSIARWLGFWGALVGLPSQQTVQVLFMVVGALLLVSGIAYWVVAFWLLQGNEWGRTGGMIVAIMAGISWLGLGVVLIGWLGAWPGTTGAAVGYIGLGVVNMLPVLYLMGAEAQEYCARGMAMPPYPYPAPTAAAPQAPPPVPTAPPPAPAPAPVGPLTRTRLIGQPVPVVAWLVVKSGHYAGQQYRLEASTILGRDGNQCHFVVDDDAVSKEHAKINFERGQFVIYDLGSTNGTFINNARIQRQMLMDGDLLRLGNTTLVFKRV